MIQIRLIRPARNLLGALHAIAAVVVLGGVLGLAACDSPAPTEPALAQSPPRFTAASTSITDFYVHAHQDDWQLFMGDRVEASVRGAAKVVIIYATAGAVSLGRMNIREAAANASIDSIAGSGTWSCGTQVIAAHGIRRCTKGNTVSYYMRLPNPPGGVDGAGYRSMSSLRDAGGTLAALDNSTTYSSWADLYSTIAALVDFESAGQAAADFVVNAPDYDRTINPNDHADHSATADAVRAAAATRNWNLALYIDYWTRYGGLAVNLSAAEHDIKQREFLAYDDYMRTHNLESWANDPAYNAWLWRTYYRTVAANPSPDPAAPAAPTALTATAVSATQINLSWADNSNDESGFNVERAPDNNGSAGTYAQIAQLGANVTTYSNASLNSATGYWYRVRAYNAGGNSAYSNSASAVTPPVTAQPPVAPASLTGTAPSPVQINLSWVDNSADEQGFKIERAPDNSGSPGAYVQIAVTGVNVRTYSDQGRSSATRYWYRVRAYNGNGDSNYSNAASVTTPADLPPSSLTVSGSAAGGQGKGSLRATLTWTRGTWPTVDVWRNGKRITSAATNSGSFTDNLGKAKGTYTYQVCVAGQTASANCSNIATVTS